MHYVFPCVSCGPPNDIISFFGPRLKKFANPWVRVSFRVSFRVSLGSVYRVSLGLVTGLGGRLYIRVRVTMKGYAT